MKRLFEIEDDCLDIVKRIKSIDSDYFIMRNVDRNCFELHCRSQEKYSYCLTLPYDSLDERCVSYVLKTRVQNAEEVFAEMEAENLKLQKRQISSVLNGFEEIVYDS